MLPTGRRFQANMANMRQSIPDFLLCRNQCSVRNNLNSFKLFPPHSPAFVTIRTSQSQPIDQPQDFRGVPTNDRAPFLCTRVPKALFKTFLDPELDSLYAGLLMPQQPAGLLLIAKGRWQNARQAGMETGLRCVPSPCFISSSFQSSVETLVIYKIGSITKQTDLYL